MQRTTKVEACTLMFTCWYVLLKFRRVRTYLLTSARTLVKKTEQSFLMKECSWTKTKRKSFWSYSTSSLYLSSWNCKAADFSKVYTKHDVSCCACWSAPCVEQGSADCRFASSLHLWITENFTLCCAHVSFRIRELAMTCLEDVASFFVSWFLNFDVFQFWTFSQWCLVFIWTWRLALSCALCCTFVFLAQQQCRGAEDFIKKCI